MNYSELNSKYTKLSYIKEIKINKFLLWIPFLLFIIGFLVGYYFVGIEMAIETDYKLLFGAVSGTFLAAYGIYDQNKNVKKSYNETRLQKFAIANNAKIYNAFDPSKYSVILDHPGDGRVDLAIIFDNFEVGNYSYNNNDRNSSPVTIGYARFPIYLGLPHILFDARSNNLSNFFSNLPGVLKNSQVYSLEGDFDNHFKVYIPKDKERDALEIITPDKMAYIVDRLNRYDIEYYDGYLYLYSSQPMDLYSQSLYEEMIHIAKDLKRFFNKSNTNHKNAHNINSQILQYSSILQKRVIKKSHIMNIFLFFGCLAIILISVFFLSELVGNTLSQIIATLSILVLVGITNHFKR